MNDDIIGFVMEFEDGTVWKVTGNDELLGQSYVRIEQQNPEPGLDYTPQRIQTAQAVRQRKQAELRRAGQNTLFEGPS